MKVYIQTNESGIVTSMVEIDDAMIPPSGENIFPVPNNDPERLGKKRNSDGTFTVPEEE